MPPSAAGGAGTLCCEQSLQGPEQLVDLGPPALYTTHLVLKSSP